MCNPLSPLFDTRGSVSLVPGASLFRIGDYVTQLYLVERGEIHLQRSTPNGQMLSIQSAKEGDLLAEASLYSDHYHCDAVATQASRVLRVSRSTVQQHLREDPDLAIAWSGFLARSVQQARARAEILMLKTVSARLTAWLALNPDAAVAKGQWKHLAAELGVTPEALYREFARRRREDSPNPA